MSPGRLDAMISGLTELMLGQAIYDRHARLSGRSAGARGRPIARAGRGRLGCNVAVPPDRVLERSEVDARPLIAAGWAHAPGSFS